MTTEELLVALAAKHEHETVAVVYEAKRFSIIVGDREYPFRRPYSLDEALQRVIAA